VTLTWNGRRIDWVNVAYFGAIHAVALTAPWYFSWSGFGVFVFLYWLSASIGIGVAFHRLLTHSSFKVPKALEYVLTVCGTLASQGGAINWVAMHRAHHVFSDRPGRDLHTPKDGFWWSHFGWILCELDMSYDEYNRRYAADLLADPVHRFLNRFHIFPNIILGLGLYALGGWSWVVWGIFVRLVVVLNITWAVNSATHTWGYRTYSTPEGSTNLWWVGLFAFGEGWHNNHHAFQRSARHGLAWWELDLNWIIISALAAVGIATDIQRIPASAKRFRISASEERAA
jgi:stearoyl-CoA desaturase (delta-9 desaturase)